jgi:hypothetical protein
MRIHNLYVDEKGETHFRDIEVEWKNEGPGGKTSATFPATDIINLDGAVEITASDGEKRIIGPGEVFLVEDTHGKGHFSKAVEGKMRRSIFVPLE